MTRFSQYKLCVLCVLVFVQGPQLDYSKFLHTSQRHSSLACNSCHERTDNSATPRFPGHKACTDCHRGQFTTPAIPMCVICHTNVSGNNPPLKNFPASFNERFNVRFDHAQHNTGSARPQRGCAGCHNTPVNRGAGLSIPANRFLRISRHTTTATRVTRLKVRTTPAAKWLRAEFVTSRRPTGQRAPTRVRIATRLVMRITGRASGSHVLTVIA
jgi:hypothetical protein